MVHVMSQGSATRSAQGGDRSHRWGIAADCPPCWLTCPQLPPSGRFARLRRLLRQRWSRPTFVSVWLCRCAQRPEVRTNVQELPSRRG